MPTILALLLCLLIFPLHASSQRMLPDEPTTPAPAEQTAPAPADSSCLWFRRTFVVDATSSGCPRNAFVSVATTSRYVLYVNGRNVSTSLFECSPYTFDVSRFLRPDSNTVAVLVCPTPKHNAMSTAHAPGQNATTVQPTAIAIGFFGTTVHATPFSYTSSDGWLCHTSPVSFSSPSAPSSTSTIDEHYDASTAEPHPAHGDMTTARWFPASECQQCQHASFPTCFPDISAESLYGYSPLTPNTLTDSAVHVRAVYRPRYFDRDDTDNTITYDFSPGFYGLVRVTLRDCRRGERIRIGNLVYTCSGETDEQAISRFAPIFGRKITVSGDRWFRPEQVQEIEVLGI